LTVCNTVLYIREFLKIWVNNVCATNRYTSRENKEKLKNKDIAKLKTITKMNIRCGCCCSINNNSYWLIVQCYSIIDSLPNTVGSLNTYIQSTHKHRTLRKLTLCMYYKNYDSPVITRLLIPAPWRTEWRCVAKNALKRVFTSL